MVRARQKKHSFGGIEIEMVYITAARPAEVVEFAGIQRRRPQGTHFYSAILKVGRLAPVEFPMGEGKDGSDRMDEVMDEITKTVTRILQSNSTMG